MQGEQDIVLEPIHVTLLNGAILHSDRRGIMSSARKQARNATAHPIRPKQRHIRRPNLAEIVADSRQGCNERVDLHAPIDADRCAGDLHIPQHRS
jgi:hypothetical protein